MLDVASGFLILFFGPVPGGRTCAEKVGADWGVFWEVLSFECFFGVSSRVVGTGPWSEVGDEEGRDEGKRRCS